MDVHDRMLKVCDIGEEEVNWIGSGKSKVQTNLMKTVNESVKYLEKYFTPEKITLIDSDGKEFDTRVLYCKVVKGFFKYIKKNLSIYFNSFTFKFVKVTFKGSFRCVS